MPNGSDDSKAFLAGQHEAQIERLFLDVHEIKGDVKHIMENHDKRIQRLERWRSWIAGATALLASLLGLNHIKS